MPCQNARRDKYHDIPGGLGCDFGVSPLQVPRDAQPIQLILPTSIEQASRDGERALGWASGWSGCQLPLPKHNDATDGSGSGALEALTFLPY
jgi:hypothetical protein